MNKRRFADGGETDPDLEAANASEDPIAYMNKAKRWTDTAEAVPEKKATFKEAFAAARKEGSTSFEWNGKKYSTELTSGAKSPEPTKTSASPKVASTAAGDFQRADKAAPKPKYQSLQDRAAGYEAERKASGVGMYGTKKSESTPRSITKIDKSSMEPSGMGSSYKPKMRGGEGYAKGGSVKGWGQARGARSAKIV